jgi:hydrogenase nickel incorporation protein HypB
MKEIHVIENVLKLNDELAAMNRATLRAAGVYTLNLIGAPGCGKTALLERTLEKLRGSVRCGVIVGDLATSRDGERLGRWCDDVVQVNTGRGCHLEAHQVRQALGRFDLERLDLLIVENVGNLVCPVGFDLGEDAKVGMFSLTEGEDKAAKHPHLVRAASLLLLNKLDLAPYLPFDRAAFRRDVEALNPAVELLEVAVPGDGLDPWLQWLAGKLAATAA